MVFIERIKFLFTGTGENIKKHSFKNQNYKISDMGVLYNGDKKMAENLNSNNYINDVLTNDTGDRVNIKRHQVVAQLYLSKTMKQGYIVNHKNENKIDNRTDNLEWVSSKENNVYSRNNYKNNLKLIERYSECELEEIAREREIQAVEEVLSKVYQDGKIGQEQGMEYLDQYIRGIRWV